MKMTVIRTADPSAFVHMVGASGIGLSPFILDAPAAAQGPRHLRLVFSATNDSSEASRRRAS
jgi:hypothetical protein